MEAYYRTPCFQTPKNSQISTGKTKMSLVTQDSLPMNNVIDSLFTVPTTLKTSIFHRSNSNQSFDVSNANSEAL